MPKEATDTLIVAVIGALITAFIFTADARSIYGLYVAALLFGYLIVPRVTNYLSNWRELSGPCILLELHHEHGRPCVAVCGLWPAFWSKAIVLRGYSYSLKEEGGTIQKNQRGHWRSANVLFKRNGTDGRSLFYFYSGKSQDSKESQTLVPDGLTTIALDDEGSGAGFFVNKLDEKVILRRHEIIVFRVTLSALAKTADGVRFSFWSGISAQALRRIAMLLVEEMNRPGNLGSILPTSIRGALAEHRKSVRLVASTRPETEIGAITQELMQKARNADAKFSNFDVAACVMTHDGQKFFGVNIENSSYPAGLCAESSAIARMVTDIGAAVIARVFLYSLNDAPELSPCGVCLQRISEYADRETRIVTISDAGVLLDEKLSDLLSHPFKLRLPAR